MVVYDLVNGLIPLRLACLQSLHRNLPLAQRLFQVLDGLVLL